MDLEIEFPIHVTLKLQQTIDKIRLDLYFLPSRL